MMSDATLALLKARPSWVLNEKTYAKIKILGYEQPYLDDDFLSVFPKFSTLIKSAKLVGFSIDQSLYSFFSWMDRDEHLCNILTDKTVYSNPIVLIPEHAMLTSVLGEVVDYVSEFDKGIFENYNFIFSKKNCAIFSNSGHYKYYIEHCKRLQIAPMACEDFIIFGEENGNMVMYDASSKEVFLFAPDHCLTDTVKCVEGQPEYTFYRYPGIKTFTDFAEKFAQTWLDQI
jgi:hypothetical protein